MSITFLCQAVCIGCRAPVNVWRHGDQVVIRDRSMVESPVHLCADIEQRERIDMEFIDMMGFRCPKCDDSDVALTTWSRVVDFPCDPDVESWAEAWVGPLQEHVCQPNSAPTTQQVPRPVWEAYGH